MKQTSKFPSDPKTQTIALTKISGIPWAIEREQLFADEPFMLSVQFVDTMDVSNVALALCLGHYKHEWETKGQVSYYQACRKTYIQSFDVSKKKHLKLSNYRKITTRSARLITIKDQNIDVSLLTTLRVILNGIVHNCKSLIYLAEQTTQCCCWVLNFNWDGLLINLLLSWLSFFPSLSL